MKFVGAIVFCILARSTYSQDSVQLYTPPTDSSEFLFEFDMKYLGSSVQVAPNYSSILSYLIDLMQANPSWTVHVRGHVCCGPSYRVSKRRARKAYLYLKRGGIEKDRLTHKGYNDKVPLVFPEKTEEDALKNRRVDFIISTNK